MGELCSLLSDFYFSLVKQGREKQTEKTSAENRREKFVT